MSAISVPYLRNKENKTKNTWPKQEGKTISDFKFIQFVYYYKTLVSTTSSLQLKDFCFEDPKRVITIMLLNGRKESEKQGSLQKHLNISAKLIPTPDPGFSKNWESSVGEHGFYVYSRKFMQNFIQPKICKGNWTYIF